MSKEVYITFEKSYQGIEKINEREFILHYYRRDLHLPIGTMIVARREDKNVDIKEIVIEGASGSRNYIHAVKSITGIYFLLKSCILHDYDNIRIKTELDMGDNHIFTIIYDKDENEE